MSLPPVTSHVTLSRGGELFVQREKFTPATGPGIYVNRIIVEESRGNVASFCCHWFDEFLKKELPLTKQLQEVREQFGRTPKALSGNSPIGIFTVRNLVQRQFIVLDFRVPGSAHGSVYVGTGHLGLIKSIEPQSPHALPRTKRRQLA